MKRQKPSGCYVGTEHAFQSAAIKLVRLIAGPKIHVFHPLNGAWLTPAQAGKAKAAGVTKGTPDIIVCSPNKSTLEPFVGMAIELKIWPRKVSPEQEEVHEQLRAAGWWVIVCYGLGRVEDSAKLYFNK